MKRPSLTLAAVVAAVVLAAGLAACGSSNDNGGGGGGGKASFNLTIGDLVPLTGDLSPFGPPGQKAAQLAVDQMKAAIKKDGLDQTVKLLNEDTQTDAQASTQAARKVSDAGASCIAGAWASSDTIPVARSVSIPDGILQISPASTSDEITGLSDKGLLNRTAPPDRFQGPTLAKAIADDLGGASGKTVNIGARNDSYGNGLAGTFKKAWEGAGGKVGQEVIYDPEQPSYDSEAAKIVSGNPDAIVIIDFPETFAKVGPALARTGKWDPSIAWGTDGLGSEDTSKLAGAKVVEGMRGTAPGSPDKDPSTQAFNALFKKSAPTNVANQVFAPQNFDAVMLCYLAAVAAGSADGQQMADQVRDVSSAPGTKYTWQQLPEAVKALQNGDDIDYQGASGAIDMNADGDATGGVYDIYQFEGGALKTVGEEPVEASGG